jgi:hypothetical protein
MRALAVHLHQSERSPLGLPPCLATALAGPGLHVLSAALHQKPASSCPMVLGQGEPRQLRPGPIATGSRDGRSFCVANVTGVISLATRSDNPTLPANRAHLLSAYGS